jgi:signal transduction histidine kinase
VIIGFASFYLKEYLISDFFESCKFFIMDAALKQQLRALSIFLNDMNQSDKSQELLLQKISRDSYFSDNPFFFIFYDEKEKKIISPIPIPDQEVFLKNSFYDEKKNKIQNSDALSLKNYFPNSYFLVREFLYENKKFYTFIGTKKNVYEFIKDNFIREMTHSYFINIIVLFLLYIFIIFFALLPVFFLVKKIHKGQIKSGIFKNQKNFEFNHIRKLRLTLFKALRKIEASEAERLHTANILAKHENDIKTGKIVAQIVHDLKSPLSVFEELIYQKNSYKNQVLAKKAKLALLKIYSLIDSIKYPTTEQQAVKQEKVFDFELLFLEFSSFIEEKNIQFKVDSAFKTPILFCDHQKLERCLQNLIQNALYFCKKYCNVRWEIIEDVHFKIEVSDDGKGILAENQDKIFNWRTTYNKKEGTGLGLTYVKFFADIHQGYVQYFRKDHWTIFSLFLPNVVVRNFDEKTLKENNQNLFVHKSSHSLKNEVFFLIDNDDLLKKLKTMKWPKDVSCFFYSKMQDNLNLKSCFCIYTNLNSDVIEKALAMGINVILYKRNHTKSFVFKKILQAKKIMVDEYGF